MLDTSVPQTLAQWLRHCESLHAQGIHGIDLGLDRVQAVAQRLQLRFACPVITIAGTNGKGSCCAMLEAIYHQAGYKTGVYTSPHLLRFEERCRIHTSVADAATLLPHFAAVEAARADTALTYFEFTTLAILHCLSQAALEVVILEVGLGGRLDAVNVVDADCTIITNVDIDHTDFLGYTREQIGFEKAGIARPNTPLILADAALPGSVLAYASAIGAQVFQVDHDYTFSNQGQQWLWRTLSAAPARIYAGLAHPSLRGAHQLANASAAIAAVHTLHARLPVHAQAIRTGLVLAAVPGRFQVLPGQPAIVLDLAHNPHAAQSLLHNLDSMGFYTNTHAVFGCMHDKDYRAILQSLLPVITHWHFCDLPVARAASAKTLLQTLQTINTNAAAHAQCHLGPVVALETAQDAVQSTDRIVIFGSFYTVGAVLPMLQPLLR